MEPTRGLGEEGLAGVEGAKKGGCLAFEVDGDAGADGIAWGCFGGAGEVEGKEGGVGLEVVFQETDPRGGAV